MFFLQTLHESLRKESLLKLQEKRELKIHATARMIQQREENIFPLRIHAFAKSLEFESFLQLSSRYPCNPCLIFPSQAIESARTFY